MNLSGWPSSLFFRFFFLRTCHVYISGTLDILWGIGFNLHLAFPFQFSSTYLKLGPLSKIWIVQAVPTFKGGDWGPSWEASDSCPRIQNIPKITKYHNSVPCTYSLFWITIIVELLVKKWMHPFQPPTVMIPRNQLRATTGRARREICLKDKIVSH